MPAGLVEEIQKAAIDPNAAVSTLLRQVKLAAFKLKLDSVEDWVEAELNGYSNGAELPAYRKVGGSALVRTLHNGWQPLVLENDTEFLRTASIGDSVTSIETLLAGIIASISKAMTGNLGIGITSGDITNAPLNIDQVKNLVSQIKSHAKTRTSEGVDGPALTAALQAIEKQLSSEHPTLLRSALGELGKVVVKASGSLIAHGVLAILHQILGIGIPA
jgi:hypothetical protein